MRILVSIRISAFLLFSIFETRYRAEDNVDVVVGVFILCFAVGFWRGERGSSCTSLSRERMILDVNFPTIVFFL